MAEIKKNKKGILEVSEPTDIQVTQTKKMVKDRYDIIIPKSEARKLAKLIKELDWWLKLDEKPGSSKHVSEEKAMEFKDLFKKVKGEDMTTAEASDSVRSLMVLVPYKEKQRLADEIRAILVTYRKVLRDPVVAEKTIKLLRFHYNLDLTKYQLEQLIQYLSKKLWYKEGLDESLEKCLDDLLVYADKRKRGKRVNGLNLHDKMRQALDLAISDLKLAGKEFDPLYREQD